MKQPESLLQLHQILLLFTRSCCRGSEEACLAKEQLLQQVLQQLARKRPFIFGIFPIILSIFGGHLVVYYLTKPL